MKIRFTILLIVMAGYFCSAQVGIGTTNPQKELHIAGSNSTIRFDNFNTSYSSLYNDGVNLARVFVNGRGDLVLGNGLPNSGASPLNFLIEDSNFIPDDPYSLGENTGYVINNNDLGEDYVEELFRRVLFTVPQKALVEVKYGITTMIRGSDISLGTPFTDVTYDQAIKVGVFFCIDIDNDGLDSSESAKKYGYNGQYYESQYGGIDEYSYINGQGYLTLPAGTHRIHFFGAVRDHASNYTSVGYGGEMDYLKIRIYN